MNKKQIVIGGLLVLVSVSILIGSGFKKYYIYSQRERTVLYENYEEEGFYSLCLGFTYAFSNRPVLRISASLLILGSFLLCVVGGSGAGKFPKHHIKKIVLADGMVIEAGKPYPGHPEFIVEKINKDGNIRIKGLKGFRDAQAPSLKGLSKRQKEQFQKTLKQLEKERKEYEG